MRSRIGWAAGLALALTLVGLLSLPAQAQAPTPSDDDVNAVAKDLYCPVCENTPLDVCPTQACAQWRETIREKLAAGWTREQIHQYFVQQYGARVLASPPLTGLNWLVYVLPPVAIGGAAYLLWRTLRSWKRKTAPAAENPASDDPYVARLEEELRRRS
jgi:cytochrome c-type biogenesis protein CcmH